jgi:hypothetical protein
MSGQIGNVELINHTDGWYPIRAFRVPWQVV